MFPRPAAGVKSRALLSAVSPHEVKLLQTLADTTAVALENVQVN
jgi:hypothetical protein